MVQATQKLLDVKRTNGGARKDGRFPAEQGLNHLRALEAESTYIFREMFAEFSTPLVLGSAR